MIGRAALLADGAWFGGRGFLATVTWWDAVVF